MPATATDIRFGEQLHTRVLAGAQDGRELSPGQVAAYVAKYSCKASHEQITSRDTNPDRWRDRGIPEQLVKWPPPPYASPSTQDCETSAGGCTCSASADTSSPNPAATPRPSASYAPAVPPTAPANTNGPTTLRSTTMTRRSCCPSGSTSAAATSTPATCSSQPASQPPYERHEKRCSICAAGLHTPRQPIADRLTSGLYTDVMRHRCSVLFVRMLRSNDQDPRPAAGRGREAQCSLSQQFGSINRENVVDVPAAAFVETINRVARSASRDETRPGAI
jgi:hypothetical protein